MAVPNEFAPEIDHDGHAPVTLDEFFLPEGNTTPLMDEIYEFVTELYEEEKEESHAGFYMVGGMVRAYRTEDTPERKDLDIRLITHSNKYDSDVPDRSDDSDVAEYLTRQASDYFNMPIDVYIGPLEKGDCLDLESLF